MKKVYVFITLTALCGLATAAFGWGNVVSSFVSPAGSTYPNGAGWETIFGTGYLFVSVNVPDYCYRVTYTGSIQRSIDLPGSATRDNDCGEISGTGYVWVQDYTTRRVYQFGYNTGSLYNSYVVPYTGPYGLAYRWSGSIYYLYATSDTTNHLYRMNATTGSVYGSYSLPFEPRGIGYGDGYLWIADGTNNRVRKCSVSGSTYDYFSVAPYGTIQGLDYDSLSNYVWAGMDSGTDRYYRFETSGSSSITPTSMGKIKAMFD
jgi:hypothetical protein